MDDKQVSDYKRILDKKNYIGRNKDLIPPERLNQFDCNFALEFAYESTSLEGNTMTREEVKRVLSLSKEEREQLLKELYKKGELDV